MALGGGHGFVVADEPAVVGFMAGGGRIETTFDLADGVDEFPRECTADGGGLDQYREFGVGHSYLSV